MSTLKFKIVLFLAAFIALTTVKAVQAQGIFGTIKEVFVGESNKVDTNGNPLNYEGEDIEDWQERELAKQNVAILKSTEVITLDMGGKYILVNKNKERMGIIYNSHPTMSQTVVVKYHDKIIYSGTIRPKKMKRIFTLHYPDEDQLCVEWTLNGQTRTVTSQFPDGYAVAEGPMGDLAHFISGGWTLQEYTPDLYTWQE